MNLLARVAISEVGPRANIAFGPVCAVFSPCWAMMAAMKPGLLRPLKERKRKRKKKCYKKKEKEKERKYN